VEDEVTTDETELCVWRCIVFIIGYLFMMAQTVKILHYCLTAHPMYHSSLLSMWKHKVLPHTYTSKHTTTTITHVTLLFRHVQLQMQLLSLFSMKNCVPLMLHERKVHCLGFKKNFFF
jgi:hypothetical protein